VDDCDELGELGDEEGLLGELLLGLEELTLLLSDELGDEGLELGDEGLLESEDDSLDDEGGDELLKLDELDVRSVSLQHRDSNSTGSKYRFTSVTSPDSSP
jgi:hypothetical protein